MDEEKWKEIDYYDRMLELVYQIDWPSYHGHISGRVEYQLEKAALEKVLYYVKLGVTVRDLEYKLKKKHEKEEI